MKKLFLLLIAYGCNKATFSQSYWQQQVNYRIDVTLNDGNNTLDGFEKLEYTNNSPDTLRFIWFHLWPNAYRNDKTAFSEQLLINGRTDFYFSNREQRGYMNRLDFKVNGSTAAMEDHPLYIDVIKLVLPQPLPPGEHITITTPFHVQVPENFSRGGHTGDSYQITQWYPKPAVYDQKGWHPIPYLDQGEFYSEFGNYNVSITVPGNYVVAATGELQEKEEKHWLDARSEFTWEPIVHRETVKRGSARYVKKTIQLYPASDKTTKTLHFQQNKVHDFAWFADKRFIVQHDTLRLPSGRTIDVYAYYLPGEQETWKSGVPFIKSAVLYRSGLIGEYPYNTVSAVEAKMGFNGGMEYPTITSISPVSSAAELESTIEHEVGHNWLYGILATNERIYPWMDEGMNTYYDNRYNAWKGVHENENAGKFLRQRIPPSFEHLLLASQVAERKDQPINTPSEYFTENNYALVAYEKAGEWMKQLEEYIGQPLFDSCMHVYFTQWGFRHPYPQDFKKVITDVSGKPTDSIFALLDTKGSLAPPVKKQLKPVALFSLANTDKYSYISVLPIPGYNQYDKLMLGVLVHNYSLPLPRLRFLAAPLYATGSNTLNYLARISYNWSPKSNTCKTEAGISVSRFSDDAYQPPGKDKIILAFRKYAPFVRLTFNNSNPLSEITRYIQFKTFFINEEGLNFKTVITGTDTSNVVGKTATNRYLNQLKLVIDNRRVLYPYRGELQVEQSDGFVRAAFTGNYYFNYSNQQGGLNLRLFAGKFFYTGSKTFLSQFETDRYHLNLTGANGYEDYTYSNYFLGRNKFDGAASQQIMARDGFFKVRTDLLSSKVGKTDNWLSAVNLTTDIPRKLNPLSLIGIPVKIFADIGTYAEAWQANAPSSRFLYDAGFQVSVLQEAINVYFPILYSTVYSDYFKSTLGKNHFWKTVSFSIDIQRLSPRKISKSLDF